MTKLSAILPLLAIVAAARGQSLYVFQPLPQYSNTSAWGISDDGRAVAGTNSGQGQRSGAFLAETDGTRNDFGLAPDSPANSFAQGISGNGTTAVGYFTTLEQPGRAFRYQSTTNTFQSLGLFGRMQSTLAYDANRDGSVVVGFGSRNGGIEEAFRWSESGGYQALGYLRGTSGSSRAFAVSADGNVIVGGSTGLSPLDAFVWTPNGGMRRLDNTGTVDGVAAAYGMNSTGSIIVGTSDDRGVAVIWRDGVVERLGQFMGRGSVLECTSEDGSIVGGWYRQDSGDTVGIVWTRQNGFELFADFLTRNEVVLPEGWLLSRVKGISMDGMSFSGSMRNPNNPQDGSRAFIATIPVPSVIVVSVFLMAGAQFRRRR